MDLKLTEHVKSTISLLYIQKPGEVPIYGTFLAKKTILAFISLKIDIFIFIFIMLTDSHDCGINGKGRPYPILWY